MTNQQGEPEALTDPSPDQLRAIARTARNSSGSASDDCGPLAYVLHGWRAAAIAFRAKQAALVDAQQPAPSEQQPFGWIKQSEIDSSKDFGGSINLWRQKYDCDVPVYLAQQPAPSAAASITDTEAFQNFHRLLCARFSYVHDERDWRRDQLSLVEHIARQVQPSPTPQADSQPAPQQKAPADELEEVLRERDDAEDFINELLDEVLGADRPEWSSAYNRYDAMNDVQERITALHKPAVDKAWGRFESAMAAPQPTPTPQADSQQAKFTEILQSWCGARCLPMPSADDCQSLLLSLEAARAPADSVLEDVARLDWLALAGPTSICVVIDRPNDGEVEVATDDVTGYGKTLREALDAARKQGANHD